MRLPSLLLLFLLAGPAQGQTVPEASRWEYGLKLGTGTSGYDGWGNGRQTRLWDAYTGGISAGHRISLPGGSPSLRLDALLERRGRTPWQPEGAYSGVLFLPLYLRTGRAAARAHLLLGGGPSIVLTGRNAPDIYSNFTVRPVEATALLGLEFRLLPLRRTETTLAFSYWQSVTPSVAEKRIGHWGVVEESAYYFGWLGATFNVYLHPYTRP